MMCYLFQDYQIFCLVTLMYLRITRNLRLEVPMSAGMDTVTKDPYVLLCSWGRYRVIREYAFLKGKRKY